MKKIGQIALLGLFLASIIASAQTVNYRLKVISWSCQTFSRGAIIQGVVQNISPRTMSEVRIHARVVGAGLRVSVNSAPIRDRSLAPGEQSSFQVRVRTNFDPINRCDIWFRNPQVIQIETLVPPPR